MAPLENLLGPLFLDASWAAALDEEGRLRISAKTAVWPETVGLTNTVGSTLATDVSRASNVTFHLKNVGTATMSAGTFVFEASVDSTDGVDGTWFGIQAARTNSNTIETQLASPGAAAGAGLAWAYEASVNAYQWVRIRCTVVPTTNSSAQWTIIRGAYATEPIPAVQAHGVTGTVSVSGTVSPSNPSAYSAVTAASTNAAVVKSSAGTLYGVSLSNPTATACHVKFYNKTSAPVVGTDVPVVTIPVPANSSEQVNFGALGRRFTSGIGIAVTAGIAATDTAAAVAGVQILTAHT